MISSADFLVGASGAIMALFGAWAAWLLRRWMRSRDVLDRRPAVMIGLLLALQCAIDLSVPQISFTAHIGGFITGFLVAAALGGRSAGRSTVPA